MQEMWSALLPDADEPALAKGMVCHTDGARAYWIFASPLCDGSKMQVTKVHRPILKTVLKCNK